MDPDLQIAHIMQNVWHLQVEGIPMRAELRLGRAIDDLMYADQIQTALKFLDQIDPSEYNPQGMIGFLSYVHMIPELNKEDSYFRLRERIRTYLNGLPGWGNERTYKALVKL